MLSNYFFTRKPACQKTDDKEKFTRLYQTYCSDMYLTAYSILGNHTMAEDAVQEAFIKLLRHLNKIQEEDTVRTKSYLKTVARNTALTMKTKAKKELSYEPTLLEQLSSENTTSPETQILKNNLITHLRYFVDKLKPQERECIELYYFHNCSTKQIADILNVSHAAVRKRLQRARKTLLDCLEKEELL